MRLAGLKQRPLSGDRVSLEDLLVRPPAVLVQSRYRSGQMSRGTTWLNHPILRKREVQARCRRTVAPGRAWARSSFRRSSGLRSDLAMSRIRSSAAHRCADRGGVLSLLTPLGQLDRAPAHGPRPRVAADRGAAASPNAAGARLWRSPGADRRGASGDLRQPARLAGHHRKQQRSRAWRRGWSLLAGHYRPACARRVRSNRGGLGACRAFRCRRPPERDGDAAACRRCDRAGRRRGHKPAARPRPFALRFLRQFRMADGKLRRPKPSASRCGADPGSNRLRSARSPRARRST